MGLQDLREKFPWPDVENIPSYYYSVDGGGRALVTDLLKEIDAKIMVEIGCFLCGSTRQWLDVKDDLHVIGVDPWEGEWHITIRDYATQDHMKPLFKRIDDIEGFLTNLEANKPYLSALANVKAYKERFTPVRGYSPEALEELTSRGIEPDLLYIDASKHREDLDAAHNIFPKARLCGDDWTWNKDAGYPMRQAVMGFVEEHGYKVRAEKATWVIDFE